MTICDFMTVKDVADRLKVSDRYVRLLIARGDLPAVRLGRAVRIGVTDLVAFLEACKTDDASAFEQARERMDKALAKLQVIR